MTNAKDSTSIDNETPEQMSARMYIENIERMANQRYEKELRMQVDAIKIANREIAEEVLPTKLEITAKDFSKIKIGNQPHSFGTEQAKIIKALYGAYKDGNPWVVGKQLTGSPDRKMQNIFSRHKTWKQVVESDGRGKYRFKVD